MELKEDTKVTFSVELHGKKHTETKTVLEWTDTTEEQARGRLGAAAMLSTSGLWGGELYDALEDWAREQTLQHWYVQN